MKKQALYILIAVVALGAVVTGASAYTGRAVTTRLSQQTAQVGKMLPELHLEEQIDRGLFRSTRAVKLQLGCVPMPAADGKSVEKTAPIVVHWRDTIRHVPFLSGSRNGVATIDSELSVVAAGVEQLFGNRAPLTVRTHIGLDGQFDSDAQVASFKLAPKPGDEIEFSGFALHLKGRLPDGAGSFSYTGDSEPIRLNAKAADGQVTATLGKMILKGTTVLDPAAPTFLMPYESEARLSDMTIQVLAPAGDGAPPTSLTFTLQGVTGTAESKLANDLWSNSNRLQGSLKTDSFVIDKFEMASALRNVHAPTFTKLTKSWMSRSFRCDQTQPLVEPMAELEALAADAFELLPHDPEYQVGPIAIELGGKRAELSYTLGVHGVAAGSAPPSFMLLMMKHAFARAEARVHLGLIAQLAAWGQTLGTAAGTAPAAPQSAPGAGALMARAMIDGFVEQGFLERDGDSVHGRIELDAGAFKLNGKPFKLPDLGALGAPDLNAVKTLMQAGGPAAP